jgi:N-acetyl sugar amidotransferase
MDTTDPNISFDAQGMCNHCKTYDEKVRLHIVPDADREQRLGQVVDEIKSHGRGKEYDCVIGVSGGVDSSYVAYLVKQWGLRPLAVHLDNGWDSCLAVSNIERLLKKLGIDLHTVVLDWEEFKDLQLAFLRASTPDSDIPSDHAIGAVLLQTAAERGIKYIVHGGNVRTEGIMPAAWSSRIIDWKYMRSIHRRFGQVPLTTFPHLGLVQRLLYFHVKKIRLVYGLNYVPYCKQEALHMLEQDFGWVYYGGKHYESVYTRFFQGYILVRKFGYDKRRAHFSTLICSGEMTRERAIEEMKKDPYPPGLLEEDMEFVLRKFALSRKEFEEILSLPVRSYADYPSYERNPLYKPTRWLYWRLTHSR